MGAQRSIEMVHEANIGRVVETLTAADESGLEQQFLSVIVAFLGQMRLFGFFIDRVVARLDELTLRDPRERARYER